MLLLVAIAVAYAGPSGPAADPQLIASIVAAVVTTLSGGGGLWWLRRNKAAGEGRDDQSARAKAAIARDNADQVMREVTAGYRDDMASLVAQLAEVRTDAATNRAAVSVVRDELKRIDSSLTGLRTELQQAIRDERAGAQGAAMIAAANALSDRLTAAMRDIERRGGDHVSR